MACSRCGYANVTSSRPVDRALFSVASRELSGLERQWWAVPLSLARLPSSTSHHVGWSGGGSRREIPWRSPQRRRNHWAACSGLGQRQQRRLVRPQTKGWREHRPRRLGNLRARAPQGGLFCTTRPLSNPTRNFVVAHLLFVTARVASHCNARIDTNPLPVDKTRSFTHHEMHREFLRCGCDKASEDLGDFSPRDRFQRTKTMSTTPLRPWSIAARSIGRRPIRSR